MKDGFEEKNEIGYKCGIMVRFKGTDIKIIKRVNWYIFSDGIIIQQLDVTEPKIKPTQFMNYAEIDNLMKILNGFLLIFDTGDLNDLVSDLVKRLKSVMELRNVENALLSSK